MISAIDLLNKYDSALRKIIETKVSRGKGAIEQVLKLNSPVDFDFLIAAMDVLDDASAAVSHVQRFGLAGPTKYNDLGEMYLRLYGLLSAAYIQQQSIIALFRILNVPNLKKTKALLDALQVRELRHKLAAHSGDYLNKGGKKEAYVPLRFDLGSWMVTAVRHTHPMDHEKVDIREAIEVHLRLIIDSMDQIVEKAIGTLFKTDASRRAQFGERLRDLRIEKSGGLVFEGPSGGPKIRITFVGPADSSKSAKPKREGE